MNEAVRAHALPSSSVGAKWLAAHFAQILDEFERIQDTHRAFGRMRVCAAQAIRELGDAEYKSLDPLDQIRQGVDMAARVTGEEA